MLSARSRKTRVQTFYLAPTESECVFGVIAKSNHLPSCHYTALKARPYLRLTNYALPKYSHLPNIFCQMRMAGFLRGFQISDNLRLHGVINIGLWLFLVVTLIMSHKCEVKIMRSQLDAIFCVCGSSRTLRTCVTNRVSNFQTIRWHQLSINLNVLANFNEIGWSEKYLTIKVIITELSTNYWERLWNQFCVVVRHQGFDLFIQFIIQRHSIELVYFIWLIMLRQGNL